MEFNDNANLYSDPNAYIQNWGYNVDEPKQKTERANNQPPPNFFSQNIYPADNSCPLNFNFQPNCKPPHKPNGNSGQQNCHNGQYHCQKPPQKVVFSEPYESVPNFYLNNNFKKGNCDCIPKPKPKCPPPKPPFSFDLKNILPLLSGLFKGGSGAGGIGNILSMLNQNSSGEQGDGEQSGDEKSSGWQNGVAQGGGWQSGVAQGGNLDFSTLIKNLSNSGGLDGILNLFKPKKKDNKSNMKSSLFKNYNNNTTSNEQIDPNKSADFVIKNYSRVE